MKHCIYLILIIYFIILIFQGCDQITEKVKKVQTRDSTRSSKELSDLEFIKNRGRLIALTNFNSTDYFVYRGTPMGYQYDLLRAYAEYLDVKLEIMVSNNLEETFELLNNEKCDLVAKNLTITKARSKIVAFSHPHNQTRQVLVQRKPADWLRKTDAEIESELIRDQINLAGKKVYVQKNTAYSRRLKSLSDEIGDTIHIIETELYGVEELVSLVAKGQIDYTVCDENVGLVNASYFPILDIETPVSFKQNVAWAVRKDSKKLLKSINKWMKDFIDSKEYRIIYHKYFLSRRAPIRRQSDYFSLTGGRISIYDEIIKRESKKIPWDWRLLASLIRTESNFNPTARSWAGAYGLMQIMPGTFVHFGASEQSTPEENIMAGVRYIKWLDRRFKESVPDSAERIKFILASYNIGQGHIDDAMRLAEKFGKDPSVWENSVSFYLYNKTNPKYYEDEVVRFGYCRGDMANIYVDEILERYEHYKQLIDE